MGVARAGHTATLLSNGLVLVVGGNDSSGSPIASAELFHPYTVGWGVLAYATRAPAGVTKRGEAG